MAWYNRLFTWVTDRDNGIPITASRMDAEFDGIATALNSLHTAQVTTPEWVAEANSVAWVSATQFKVIGIDVSSIYHIGRRVKIIHFDGARTGYATVTAVSFSSDTTVTVQTDDTAALLSAVTAVYYGIISYINPSYLSPRTAMTAYAGNQSYATPGVIQKIDMLGTVVDTRSEFSLSTDLWTCKETGYYNVAGAIQASVSGSDQLAACYIVGSQQPVGWKVLHNGKVETISISAMGIPIAKGGTLNLAFYCAGSAASIWGDQTYDTFLSISRVP